VNHSRAWDCVFPGDLFLDEKDNFIVVAPFWIVNGDCGNVLGGFGRGPVLVVAVLGVNSTEALEVFVVSEFYVGPAEIVHMVGRLRSAMPTLYRGS
jgi:hypothetical protein